MSTIKHIWNLLSVRSTVKKNAASSYLDRFVRRNYSDKSKPGSTSKQVVAQGTVNEERVRVRRARVSDGPRVLQYVRENVRVAWPAAGSPPAVAHVVIADYVSRALAQGHSMLAEQLEPRRGWSQIRGLAVCASVCPWDAAALESWARCIKCPRSHNLMRFTAHCLQAPALHDKYRTQNILQVILIVPPDNPKSKDIINILAKNCIQRGREKKFPLVRFDVSSDLVSQSLEELKLKKEWTLSYQVLPQPLTTTTAVPASSEKKEKEPVTVTDKNKNDIQKYIAVYTASCYKKDKQPK